MEKKRKRKRESESKNGKEREIHVCECVYVIEHQMRAMSTIHVTYKINIYVCAYEYICIYICVYNQSRERTPHRKCMIYCAFRSNVYDHERE